MASCRSRCGHGLVAAALLAPPIGIGSVSRLCLLLARLLCLLLLCLGLCLMRSVLLCLLLARLVGL